MTGDVKLASRLGLAGSVADQVSWSAAFFLFNATVGIASPRHFAHVAVATAFALVALAVVRAWVVDSAVLFAGVGRSARATVKASLAGGVVASASYAAWTTATGSQIDPGAMLLAFGLVYGDNARYAWITRGAINRSFPVSVSYLSAACICTAGAWTGWRGEYVTWAWVGVLICLGSASIVDDPQLQSQKLQERTYTRHRIGLTLEALYSMLAAQIGVLAMSLVAASTQIAGFRLAYAVALAPAGLLLQGIGTQLLRHQGALRGTRAGLRFAVLWGLASAAVYIANTAAVLIATSSFSISSGDLAAPYVIPLCAFLAASSMSNSVHTVLRFVVAPAASQSIKLAALGSDVALQVTGVAWAGSDGLIVGLYAAAVARLGFWLVTIAWCRRKEAANHG